MIVEDPYGVAVELRRLLMAGVQPLRVMVDPDLPPGQWYVVRAPKADELRVTREQPCASK